MYLDAVALIAFAVCLPLTALLWQAGRVALQTRFLDYKRERNREQAEQATKQAEAALQASAARLGALELTLGSMKDALEIRIKRLEEGRHLQRIGT